MSDLVDFLLEQAGRISDDEIIEPERRVLDDEFVLGQMTIGESKFYTVCRNWRPVITQMILGEFITEENTIQPEALQMLELGAGRVLWATFDQLLRGRLGLPQDVWPGTRRDFRVVLLIEREERPFQYVV